MLSYLTLLLIALLSTDASYLPNTEMNQLVSSQVNAIATNIQTNLSAPPKAIVPNQGTSLNQPPQSLTTPVYPPNTGSATSNSNAGGIITNNGITTYASTGSTTSTPNSGTFSQLGTFGTASPNSGFSITSTNTNISPNSQSYGLATSYGNGSGPITVGGAYGGGVSFSYPTTSYFNGYTGQIPTSIPHANVASSYANFNGVAVNP